MARSVAYAVLCFLLVAVHDSDGSGRIARATGGGHGDAHKWSYDEAQTGPSQWPRLFNQCGGSEQSPINIITKTADENEDLDGIDFDNYDKELDDATMDNNGHTVIVMPGKNDPDLTIDDGGLDDTYKLIQIHFHWGSNNTVGSEHAIDGVKCPMEMHLVHINKNYGNMEEALKKDDGLAVLGVLFELDDEDNDHLDPIVDNLEKVKDEIGNPIDIDDLEVGELLPDNLMPYYRYQGSLTTPPCSEVVTWTVFEDKVPISEDQLKKFRALMEDEPGEKVAERLVDNFRHLQPLHTRVIQKSTSAPAEEEATDEPDGAQNIPVSASMTFGLTALAVVLTYFNRV